MPTSALEISHLRAGYPGNMVIRGASLVIRPGDWCALVGPNGCGKSTLLDCVSGRLPILDGEIRISGQSMTAAEHAAKSALGYACPPEELPALLTSRQCLEVVAASKGVDAVDAAVMELASRMGFSPYLDQFVDTLSFGTKQKLAILSALVGAPSLIVLDEAFNGLDPASSLVLKRHLTTLLESSNSALLIATHALDSVERYANRAALLMEGTLIHEWSREEIRSAATTEGGFDAEMARRMEPRGPGQA
jgi:ABC-2 type transport system ATP-binding protein